MPVHHTDCDMLTFGDGQVKVAVGATTGVKPFTLEASAWRTSPSVRSLSARLPWRLAGGAGRQGGTIWGVTTEAAKECDLSGV
jgi:hypothetical protein